MPPFLPPLSPTRPHPVVLPVVLPELFTKNHETDMILSNVGCVVCRKGMILKRRTGLRTPHRKQHNKFVYMTALVLYVGQGHGGKSDHF